MFTVLTIYCTMKVYIVYFYSLVLLFLVIITVYYIENLIVHKTEDVKANEC